EIPGLNISHKGGTMPTEAIKSISIVVEPKKVPEVPLAEATVTIDQKPLEPTQSGLTEHDPNERLIIVNANVQKKFDRKDAMVATQNKYHNLELYKLNNLRNNIDDNLQNNRLQWRAAQEASQNLTEMQAEMQDREVTARNMVNQ